MKAIIIFDTKFGNTQVIADAICDGMKEVGFNDVKVQNGNYTIPEELRDADVWIFGSPTHMRGTTRNFKKLLKWIKKEQPLGKMGVAFDTRLEGSSTGAANKIADAMEKNGVKLIHEPAPFTVVANEGPLASGEESRAVTLGRRIVGDLRLG